MKPTIEQLRAWDTEARIARRDVAMDKKPMMETLFFHQDSGEWRPRPDNDYKLNEDIFYRIKPKPRVIECEGWVDPGSPETFMRFCGTHRHVPCKATFVIEEGV